MPITALYASLLAPLFLYLAFRVIRVRRTIRVAIGDGGNAGLLRAMRVHANFAEYVPMTLVLIGLAESLQTKHWLLHAMGLALLAGRIVHAAGVSRTHENFALRVTGIATTFTVLGVAAVACLVGALGRVVV